MRLLLRRLALPLLCLAALVPFPARGQGMNSVDSLTTELFGARGVKRMDVLLALSERTIDNTPEDSRHFAERALHLADSLQNVPGRAEALNMIGLYNFVRGRYETALEYFLQVLRIATATRDTSSLENALTNLGHVYGDLKQYSRALQYYERDLSVATARRDSGYMAESHNNIATILVERGEINRALEEYATAKTIASRVGDPSTLALIANNVGDLYYHRRQYADAMGNFLEARAHFQTLDDKLNLAVTLHNLGLVNREMGRYREAIGYLMQSLAIDSALTANAAMLDDSRELADTYARMHDYPRAYQWQKVHDRLMDSVFSIDQLRKIAELESAHTIETRLDELNDVKRQNELTNERYRYSVTLRNALIGGFALVLLLIVMVMNRYQLKRRSEAEYRARTEDLEIIDRLVKLINREVSLEQLYRSLLDQTRVIFPKADTAAFLMYDESTGGFRVISSYGMEDEEAHSLVLAAPVLSGEWIENVERVEKIRDGVSVFHFKAASEAEGAPRHVRLIVDIEIEHRLAGILLFDSRKHVDAFRVPDIDRWLRFREHALSAIIKARMLESMEKALAAAEEASTVKTRLLSIASHDLKNPLGVVIGIAEIIELETEHDPKIRELAGMIGESGRRMLALLHDILDTTELDAGKIVLNLKLTSVETLVESVVYENQPLAERKGQQLIYTCSTTDSLHVMADGKRLREAVANLVDNAIKFSPLNKRIWVEVSKPDKIRIEVRDEGPGLSEDDARVVFGHFQRLSARPTGGESSSGIGLSIVKQIVEMHGGTVRVENRQEGGAAFIIEL
jgi:signal transduction histidine kinase/Tfp pilus assembly protein PilF